MENKTERVKQTQKPSSVNSIKYLPMADVFHYNGKVLQNQKLI